MKVKDELFSRKQKALEVELLGLFLYSWLLDQDSNLGPND